MGCAFPGGRITTRHGNILLNIAALRKGMLRRRFHSCDDAGGEMGGEASRK